MQNDYRKKRHGSLTLPRPPYHPCTATEPRLGWHRRRQLPPSARTARPGLRGRGSSESTGRARYLILLPVFMRIHCGMGRFCFCFLARKRLILNVLCDDCKRAQPSVPHPAPAPPPGLGQPREPHPAPSRSPAAAPPGGPPARTPEHGGPGDRARSAAGGADGRGCLTMARSGAASRRWRRPRRRKGAAERRGRSAPWRPGGPARREGRRRPREFVRVYLGLVQKTAMAKIR